MGLAARRREVEPTRRRALKVRESAVCGAHEGGDAWLHTYEYLAGWLLVEMLCGHVSRQHRPLTLLSKEASPQP
jgi:hypothetical protein